MEHGPHATKYHIGWEPSDPAHPRGICRVADTPAGLLDPEDSSAMSVSTVFPASNIEGESECTHAQALINLAADMMLDGVLPQNIMDAFAAIPLWGGTQCLRLLGGHDVQSGSNA